ncbi:MULTISPECIES: hypothetical protein [unclassified Sphingobacterium]|nr:MULTISPECIES: hypothetical protein [unclassified Sphingobacterium]
MIITLQKTINNLGLFQTNQPTGKDATHSNAMSMRMRMHTHLPTC